MIFDELPCGSAVDRIVFYFLQDLMSDIHGPESVYFGHQGRSVEQNRIAEFFQFHPDGIDFGDGGIGKGDGFFAVRGFDVECEDIVVPGCFELENLRFFIQKIDTNIGIFLE